MARVQIEIEIGEADPINSPSLAQTIERRLHSVMALSNARLTDSVTGEVVGSWKVRW